MTESDRKTAFFEELLNHTPVDRRAFVQRAAALGIAGPAAFRAGGSALAQEGTPVVFDPKGRRRHAGCHRRRRSAHLQSEFPGRR